MTLLTNRLSTRNGNRLVKTGRELTEFERSRFGKSKMMRYVAGTNEPVYPIGYTQHKNPLFRKKTWNYYTPEGREGIHNNLRINMAILLSLMRKPPYGYSAEYADNRISLFSAQWGKCAVMATGVDIQIDVLGIARKKNNVKLFFIEAKKTKLTLRDLGQLWAYCKLIDPEEAFLFSSAGLGSLNKLVQSFRREDLLDFGDGKKIKKMKIAKWDVAKDTVDLHSLIPKI